MTQAIHDTMHAAAIDEFGGPITPHTLPVEQAGVMPIDAISISSVGDRLEARYRV